METIITFMTVVSHFIMVHKFVFFMGAMVVILIGYLLDATRQSSAVVQRQHELESEWDRKLATKHTVSGWAEATNRGERHSVHVPAHQRKAAADLFKDNNYR